MIGPHDRDGGSLAHFHHSPAQEEVILDMDNIRSKFAQESPDPGSKQESDREPDLGIKDHRQGGDPEDLYIVDHLSRKTGSFRGSKHGNFMPIPLQQRCYPADKIIYTV